MSGSGAKAAVQMSLRHVAEVPKGDITPTKDNRLFDHLIGAGGEMRVISS
jgi:hypothetical protein